jgi:hypothetical protein
MRGPILYCLKEIDHPDLDLKDIVLPADAPLSAEFVPDLLGSVAVLRGRGIVKVARIGRYGLPPSMWSIVVAKYRAINRPSFPMIAVSINQLE